MVDEKAGGAGRLGKYVGRGTGDASSALLGTR